ncbi:MAG: DUF6321 domain-containing protein [Janthinobacterium lividum]
MARKQAELSKTAVAKKEAKPKSMPKAGRNPEGGLTAKGREFFAARDGSHLKAGVTGAADTPEKMKRKGSFLVRTFTHPRGPMKDDKGQPTRLALSAHAWGEKVPGNDAAAHKLAQTGHRLLEQYHRAMGDAPRAKPASKKAAAKKPSAAKSASKTRKA